MLGQKLAWGWGGKQSSPTLQIQFPGTSLPKSILVLLTLRHEALNSWSQLFYGTFFSFLHVKGCIMLTEFQFTLDPYLLEAPTGHLPLDTVIIPSYPKLHSCCGPPQW